MMGRIRVLKRSIVYEGWVIRVVREALELNGRRMVRASIEHPGAVVVVPVLDRSRIVFVRQYRRAIKRSIMELPAGTLERGERPSACARRELQEETGWRAGRIRSIGRFYTAPGILSEVMHIYLADRLTPGRAKPDPDEQVTPVILPLSSALARMRSGAICDAKTVIGLLFAERLLRGRRPSTRHAARDSLGTTPSKGPSVLKRGPASRGR